MESQEQRYFRTEGISKRFGGLTALDDVSIHIDKGKVVGLIGPNGAGKTTFFNAVTNFLPKDGGRVYFKGQDVTNLTPDRLVREGIARTWQNLRIFPRMTTLENVMMAIPKKRDENIFVAMFQPTTVRRERGQAREEALSILRSLKLDSVANKEAAVISYPEQKVLAFARLLATRSELLLLDEPAAGLDIKYTQEELLPLLREIVKSQGRTMCIVEHVIDVVRGICDWIYFLDHGRVISEGTVEQILSNPKLEEIYFGKTTKR